ncbi:MAG: homoserine O-acetyltransferase [Bacteroidales bacterium]|nr:homoserine O-acetyltransferase [Bacteroidales bacterium]
MLKHTYTYEEPFELEAGGCLREGITICYHTSCEERGNRPVIWICHALTANSDAEDWWNTLVGPGLLFDTEKFYIVCANILGSCYGTTGPAMCPEAPMRRFPLVTIRDLVKAHNLLRLHLGIERIDLLIGGSNGGFQSVEWAISNPSLVKNLCLIATSAIVSPWCSANMESQRMALETDPTFDEQKDLKGGARGLATARSMSMLTYRNYEGYGRTQFETDPDFLQARRAITYQQYQGQKLVNRFDAYSYYSLLLGVDTHNTGRGRGGVEAALGHITAKTLCIGIDSDILFPVSESRRIAEAVPDGKCEVISSAFGHDGFLLEYQQIGECLRKHFNLFE